MRKIIFITLLLTSTMCATDLDFKPINSRSDSGFMIDTGRILKKTYIVLNENIDYLLTSKGIKKTAVILVPFVIFYGRYFGMDPIKDVGRGLLCQVGRVQAYYELQKMIGANQQLIDEIKAQPWNMFCVITVEIIRKIKIPFIM